MMSFDLSRYYCMLIIASAFGPYLLPDYGLRLDHFVIYGLLLVFFLRIASVDTIFYKLNRQVRWVLLVLLFNAVWICFSSSINVFQGRQLLPYETLGAFEGIFQPVALILVVSWMVSGMDIGQRYDALKMVCATTIALLCLNTVLCEASIFFDTSPVLAFFHGRGDVIEGTVYSRAASLYRYSGIFNQPIESGLAYSTGLLFWVFLAVGSNRVVWATWPCLIFLLAGGIFSVSKVFIFGGVPLALGLWIWCSIDQSGFKIAGMRELFKKTGLGLVLLYSLLHSWSGLDRFFRYFSPGYYSERGVVSGITAKRFGVENGGVMPKFNQIWDESPLWGFGAYIDGALDNAYLEFFYYGGLVALFLYVFILLIIVFQALRSESRHCPSGKLLFAIWVLIMGAGMGAPVLTLNRASVFLWVAIVIIFSLLAAHRQQENKPIPYATGENTVFAFSRRGCGNGLVSE